MLEKTVEAKIKKYAVSKGCLYQKFTSPGTRAVTDRIIIAPLSKGCRGSTAYLEVKAPGKKPTKLQERSIRILDERNCFAGWVDNFEDGVKFIDNFLDYHNIQALQ